LFSLSKTTRGGAGWKLSAEDKEAIWIEWIPMEENSVDMLRKNLQGPLFVKHASVYVSDMLSMDSKREVLWDKF
jgi:hypothetical protein